MNTLFPNERDNMYVIASYSWDRLKLLKSWPAPTLYLFTSIKVAFIFSHSHLQLQQVGSSRPALLPIYSSLDSKPDRKVRVPVASDR